MRYRNMKTNIRVAEVRVGNLVAEYKLVASLSRKFKSKRIERKLKTLKNRINFYNPKIAKAL
jgi:hypothetical protein